MKCLGWKSAVLLIICGLCLVVIGEMLRISAMLTASRSFSHTLEWRRREDHSLVTTGVYSLCRHPSYAGISSQLAYTSKLLSHSVNYCRGPLTCTSNQLNSTAVAHCAAACRLVRVGDRHAGDAREPGVRRGLCGGRAALLRRPRARRGAPATPNVRRRVRALPAARATHRRAIRARLQTSDRHRAPVARVAHCTPTLILCFDCDCASAMLSTMSLPHICASPLHFASILFTSFHFTSFCLSLSASFELELSKRVAYLPYPEHIALL